MNPVFAILLGATLVGGATKQWDYSGEGTFGKEAARSISLQVFTGQLKHLPHNHVEVETRGFLTSDLNKASSREARKRISRKKYSNFTNTARHAHFNTPWGTMEKSARYEYLVNNVHLVPRLDVSVEFDCDRKMARTLSIQVRDARKVRSDNSPSKWMNVDAAGLGARLYSTSCS